ncbi:putative Uncharacterized 50.6 kDa protein in the 5'region of gyrA and gyrB [Streptomyces misionensis JCM 4497]
MALGIHRRGPGPAVPAAHPGHQRRAAHRHAHRGRPGGLVGVVRGPGDVRLARLDRVQGRPLEPGPRLPPATRPAPAGTARVRLRRLRAPAHRGLQTRHGRPGGLVRRRRRGARRRAAVGRLQRRAAGPDRGRGVVRTASRQSRRAHPAAARVGARARPGRHPGRRPDGGGGADRRGGLRRAPGERRRRPWRHRARPRGHRARRHRDRSRRRHPRRHLPPRRRRPLGQHDRGHPQRRLAPVQPRRAGTGLPARHPVADGLAGGGPAEHPHPRPPPPYDPHPVPRAARRRTGDGVRHARRRPAGPVAAALLPRRRAARPRPRRPRPPGRHRRPELAQRRLPQLLLPARPPTRRRDRGVPDARRGRRRTAPPRPRHHARARLVRGPAVRRRPRPGDRCAVGGGQPAGHAGVCGGPVTPLFFNPIPPGVHRAGGDCQWGVVP